MRMLLAIFLMFVLQGCGTTTGNALVSSDRSIVSLTVGSIEGESVMARSSQPIQLRVCYERVHFSTPQGDVLADPDDVIGIRNMVAPGFVTVDDGTALGRYRLTRDNYESVSLELTNRCPGGHSVEVVRADRLYYSTDVLTLKFEGIYELGDSEMATVRLDFRPIFASLKDISHNEEIKNVEQQKGKGDVPKKEKTKGNANPKNRGIGSRNRR